MNVVSLYIDESGNLGISMGRYFLMCALEVDSTIKSAISKRAGRVICIFKQRNGIPKIVELKGSRLKDDDRLELLDKNFFKGIKVRYIVFDLKQTTMLLAKPDDKKCLL